MDFKEIKKLMFALSLAAIIVIAAAGILRYGYNAFAYTETVDQYSLTHTNSYPTSSINLTDHYIYGQQSFTTSASTTNLTDLSLFAKANPANCSGYSDNLDIAICSGETPAGISHETYVWPCNGGSALTEITFVGQNVLATTTAAVSKLTLNGYAPITLIPSSQYYVDIRTYHHNTDTPCIEWYYGTSGYAGGRLFTGADDMYFVTYRYTDYIPATSSDIHIWELDDLEALNATTSPMVITPDYNVCYYDNADPCYIQVYWNEAADARDDIIILSKYIFGGAAVDFMDTHTISYTDERTANLLYTPKETTATTVPICITEVWYDGGMNYKEDCTPQVHWKSQATLDAQYAQLFGYAECECTEETGLLECGGKKIGCWLFIPSATSTMNFEKARQQLLSGFPFGTYTAVEREVIKAQIAEKSPLNFPIYWFGYPTASSTLLGYLDVMDLRENLDNFGWAYVYFIFKYMIYMAFFGLILWRLWHIITGEHFEKEQEIENKEYVKN